jgi:hypothetical protein
MPHGPVHSWVGGVGGGNGEATYDALEAEGLVDASQARQLKVALAWHFKLPEHPASVLRY